MAKQRGSRVALLGSCLSFLTNKMGPKPPAHSSCLEASELCAEYLSWAWRAHGEPGIVPCKVITWNRGRRQVRRRPSWGPQEAACSLRLLPASTWGATALGPRGHQWGGARGLRAGGGAALSRCAPAPQVHLQTQQEVKLRMTGMALQVVRSDGFLALYNGLSASLCRQVPGDPHQRPPSGAPTGPGPRAHALSSPGRQEGWPTSPGSDVAAPALCGHPWALKRLSPRQGCLGGRNPESQGAAALGGRRAGQGGASRLPPSSAGPSLSRLRPSLTDGETEAQGAEKRVQGFGLS